MIPEKFSDPGSAVTVRNLRLGFRIGRRESFVALPSASFGNSTPGIRAMRERYVRTLPFF